MNANEGEINEDIISDALGGKLGGVDPTQSGTIRNFVSFTSLRAALERRLLGQAIVSFEIHASLGALGLVTASAFKESLTESLTAAVNEGTLSTAIQVECRCTASATGVSVLPTRPFPTLEPTSTPLPNPAWMPVHAPSPFANSTSTPTQQPSISKTVTPVLSPTAVIVARKLSSLTCDELGWTNAASWGSSEVCGNSQLDGSCSGAITWREAVSLCEDGGARLCSVAELQANEARSTGCGIDRDLLWTSDACDGGYNLAYGASFGGSDTPCVSGAEANKVRCCADK